MAKTKPSISLKVGIKIRELRIQQGLTQQELAFKAGLYRSYIGQIERAEKNITLVNLEIIAVALEVDIKDLLK
jgi:transcriptional regulator with XRE-family HTH domain